MKRVDEVMSALFDYNDLFQFELPWFRGSHFFVGITRDAEPKNGRVGWYLSIWGTYIYKLKDSIYLENEELMGHRYLFKLFIKKA